MKTAALILAAAVVLPSFARAQETNDARKPVIAAIKAAEENAKRLSKIPLDLAGLVPVFPYGDEYDVSKQKLETEEDAVKVVMAKSIYWDIVVKAMSLEAARLQKELAEYKGDNIGDMVRQVSKAGRLARAAAGIFADAQKDVVYVQSLDKAERTEGNQTLIDRKAKLLEELKGYKDAIVP